MHGIIKKFFANNNTKRIKIRKVYHACFLITYSDNTTILIDPYFGKDVPASFVVTEPCKAKKEELPKIDVLIVTHEHFDHFDKEAVEYFVSRDNCVVIAPNPVLTQMSLQTANSRVVKVDDELTVAKILIKILPCQHPQSDYPIAFLLDYDNTKIYYAGDTINLPEVKINADIGIMPCGGTFTADLFVFVSMTRKLELKYAIPMHYNTFEIIKIDLDKLKERASEKLKDTKLIVLDNNKEFLYKIPC